MKSTVRTCLILLLVFILAPSLAADAATASLSEAILGASSTPSVIHAGVDGKVYVVDEEQAVIWRINPASGAYEMHFPIGGAMDAVADRAGKIWWTAGSDTFGYIDPKKTDEGLAVWYAPEYDGDSPNLGPLVVLDGNVWMATFFSSQFGIFKFDPNSSQLCHYDVPGGSFATGLVAQGGRLWWLTWNGENNKSLMSLSTGGSFARYNLGRIINQRAGITADADSLWWAEGELDSDLYRFTPTNDMNGAITRFALPSGAQPRQVSALKERIWYTDAGGWFGSLDPQTAESSTETLAATQFIITPDCQMLGAAELMANVAITGTLAWSDMDVTTTQPQTGLEIYPLVEGASPLGIAAVPGGIWVTDKDRGSLVRLKVGYNYYLPYTRK